MKILHVITKSDLGGAQTVVITLSNAMCSENEITVAAGGNDEMWDVLDERVNKVRLQNLKREVSLFNDFITCFSLYSLYRKIKPDVIHLHSSKAGMIGRLVFPKRKVVYSVHGFDSIRLAYRKYLIVEKILKKRCKALVVASDYDRVNMNREGINDNIHLVYNGIAYPNIIKTDELNSLIERTSKKVVICIARISPQKRFEDYVELAKQLPKYIFVWIGADREYQNLPVNLHCFKGIPNAKRFIENADLFVLPSNYEGVPIAIIDALSFGKPVVASNVGGISEIVLNDYNGYVVENDINSFVTAIQTILEDEQLYQKFSANSHSIFRNKLTIEQMVLGYKRIYSL